MTTPNYILIEECKLIEITEKALKRAARYERIGPRIKKGTSKVVYKGKREKLEKWPRRKKSKKEKEGTRRGEKWRDADRSKRGARKDNSRPNYRRKKKERSRREGEKDKGIQIYSDEQKCKHTPLILCKRRYYD